MAHELPNLWPTEPQAWRLYEMYNAQFMFEGQWEEFAENAETIFAFAQGTEHEKDAIRFLTFATHGRAASGQWDEAWAWHERVIEVARRFGQELGLDEPHYVLHYVAPLLYGRGLLEEAADVAHDALHQWIANSNTVGGVLNYIVEYADATRHWSPIALANIYRALGRPLTEWPDWNIFIDKLEDETLATAGVDRERLRANPALLSGVLHAWHERPRTPPPPLKPGPRFGKYQGLMREHFPWIFED